MADIFTLSGLAHPAQKLQTGEVDALLLAEFGGMVEGTIGKTSIMESFLSWRPIVGTNTLTNYRNGDTVLQKLGAGSNPQPTPVDFDNVSVKVDTVMLARNAVFTLEDIQNNYDAKAALASEQGKVIAKFMDSVGMIKGIKAARIIKGDGTGGTTKLPSGWFGGGQYTLAAANDEIDPNKLQYQIENAVAGFAEKDIDAADEGMVIYVRPAQYLALSRNDKLINTQYSMGNGNYADGTVLRSVGLPIRSTNRLPSGAITGHALSNTANGNAYDLSAAEGKAVALIMSPHAVLAGSSIPLQSDMYWDKPTKTWMIDSWLALGAAANNPAYAAVINKF
jgi:hypothetical protein